MLALVLGGAQCLWQDIDKAKDICTPDVYVAINEVGTVWPHDLDIWVSFHANRLIEWVAERRSKNLPDANHLWTGPVMRTRGLREVINQHKEVLGGSSGLLAVLVALKYVNHVLLAGVPMDPTPHWHDRDRGKPWAAATHHRQAWTEALPRLGNVRSMSGWTAEQLGFPDEAWVGEATGRDVSK